MGGLYQVEDLLSVYGLGNVIIHSGLQAPFAIAVHGVRGHGDNRDLGPARISPDDTSRLQAIENGMLAHDVYLGLTPTEIASATPIVEGMTTVNDIPALTTTELTAALLAAAPAGAGL